MLAEGRFQIADQFSVHEVVVVRYVQADQFLAIKVVSELRLKTPLVLLLHDDDEISPSNVARGHFDPCTLFRPRRPCLVIQKPIPQLLRRRASPFVSAAYE